jgi:hypothetical protein
LNSERVTRNSQRAFVTSMTQDYYAHSLPGRPQEDWQRLEEHLRAVAQVISLQHFAWLWYNE